MKYPYWAIILFSSFLISISELAFSEGNKPTATANYGEMNHWLCHPDKNQADDACYQPLDASIIKADGSVDIERFESAKAPAIDCFYVYPTVSRDPTANSDLNAGAEEKNVVLGQFARFASECRTFAPVYRQITLTALIANIQGNGPPPQLDRSIGYNDVKAAWQHYLKHHNQGRGVILVGHSQGSSVLSRLIVEEIEGQAIETQIISAMLIGTRIGVAKDQVIGGTFKSMPLCTSADQTQCIIAYASFRDGYPPADNSRFSLCGENQVCACTNPAKLANGGDRLDAYLSTNGANNTVWTSKQADISTPFVKVPGLLKAECASEGPHRYLKISVIADPNDPRTDDISGDVRNNTSGEIDTSWGLHLIDMNLGMGDFLTIAERQKRAYLAR